MKSDTPLDYAVFQMSPRRSRCELFISRNGDLEKLASGLVKPFVSHLKVAEDQVAQSLQSFKLEVERRRNAETWFTKGTLERFVRFVSTPEVLEMVNTFDAEMSQLEAARKIYSQGSEDQLSGAGGEDGNGTLAGSDATKKELLRAIDVRLAAVRQDLTMACSRASAAGFNPNTVSELQTFSECFGAHRLNEACSKFVSLCQRRPDLIDTWKPSVEDQAVRSSWGSDMSIDDPAEDLSVSHSVKPQQNKHLRQPAGQEQQQNKLPDQTQTSHHLSQSTLPTFKKSDSSLLKEQQNERIEEVKKEDSSNESTPSQPSQPSRRLSVQDRINLFENKQKENSGGKPVSSGKPAELRRLSSDVSSAPTVLRRWSGASDMSIDLGNDKKENSTDSPLCTPSSSSVTQPRNSAFPGPSEDNKEHKDLNDSVDSAKVETKTPSGLKNQVEFQRRGSGTVGKEEDVLVKVNQPGFLAQLRSLSSKVEQAVGSDWGSKEEKVSSGEEKNILTDQVGPDGISRTFSDRVENVSVKNQAGLQGQGGSLASRREEVEFVTRADNIMLKDQPPIQSRHRGSHSHTLSGQFEGGFGLKNKEVTLKESESDQSASQPLWRSFSGEVEEVRRKNIASSGKQPVQMEESEIPRMKVQKPVSGGTEQIRKQQARKDERESSYGSDKLSFGNKEIESQDSSVTVQISSTDQVQRVRQSKGNQERNDELKLKANELEKLFAEHKLRIPGDQTGSTRRSKPAEMQVETGASSHRKKQVTVDIAPSQFQDKNTGLEPAESISDADNFTTPVRKRVDQQVYGSSLRQNFSELNLSDDSRGKFYEKYMQKRDAKLREEWSTKGGEKEAKLKAMQDTFESSRAEMKVKFSGFADRQNSVSTARRRAEKLQSFNLRSSMKKDQPVDFVLSEEDEDDMEVPEQKYYGQDFASRSFQGKKFLANKNLSSSTPRTAAAPAPRLAAKNPNPSSGRRRMQSENPLAQSVPNFSDFRKENTKPSAGVKPANRLQGRTYARSKSSNEETPLAKEEKPRRTQSLRKRSSIPPSDSDGVALTPLKFDKEEQMEPSYQEKFSKSVDSKTFLRKGNGIDPGSIGKMKSSMASDESKDDEFEESPFDGEDAVDMVKEEQEEDIETTGIEDSGNMDNGQSRISQESDKMGMSESENGDSQRYASQIDSSPIGDLPASVPSFHAVGSMHESPGESPVSWNSRMHHSFSYPHETSDIDASMYSPMGSPASWNLHSMMQTHTDAARMRKKWGTAQKPLLVANSSQNQSRKDVTKGFKRLLKFGRKNRGSESLVDWISATTSEGDDDTEDGRDPANRSSEDLRKSRMGFTQGHPSDDGFNESDLLNEQVQALRSSIPAPPSNFKLRDEHISGSSIKAPRSFFSLSTFRSKGSDAKLR